MTALRGRRVLQPGERLFQIASQLILYHDMQSIAFDVVKGRPAKSFVYGHYANHVSTLFGVCVQMPIYYPFVASFNPALAGPLELTIFDGGMPPGLDEHTSHVMGAATLMIWSIAFVFFYEQQLDGMTAKFGERRDDWPEIARFAWALRNAAAHNGALHFTNRATKPVRWHHLCYDPQDNGKKVIGDVMKPADVFIFLMEFSDELDRLGVPLPN